MANPFWRNDGLRLPVLVLFANFWNTAGTCTAANFWNTNSVMIKIKKNTLDRRGSLILPFTSLNPCPNSLAHHSCFLFIFKRQLLLVPVKLDLSLRLFSKLMWELKYIEFLCKFHRPLEHCQIITSDRKKCLCFQSKK